MLAFLFLCPGLLDELARAILRDLTINDLFSIYMGQAQCMDRFRLRLRGFARSNVLQVSIHCIGSRLECTWHDCAYAPILDDGFSDFLWIMLSEWSGYGR